MKIHPIFLSIIITACLQYSFLYSQVKDIKFEIELERSVYFESEPIFVHVVVTNTGNSELQVNPIYAKLGFLKFIVRDNNGTILKPRETDLSGENFLKDKIAPGGIYAWAYALVPIYGTGSPLPILLTERYLHAGRYSVQAKYRPDSDTLYSKVIEFSVEQPTGSEKEALELYRNAERLYGHNNDNAAITQFMEVARQFPNSVYAPLALYQIGDIYEFALHDKTKIKEIAMLIIDKYPDNYFSESALANFMTHAESDVEKKEFLQRIISKYPNTKISKHVERSHPEMLK